MVMKFIFLFFALVGACGRNVAGGPSFSQETVDKEVLLKLVNDVRKKGCNCGDTYYPPAPPLTWNNVLEKVALEHSHDMSQNKYFSHTGADGSSAGERIQRAGYAWKFYGENIASGYRTEQEVITGWIGSPGHCKNIMGKDYREMGVAREGNLWTQEFGTK
jgi:uncharacterized protein YkwD